MIIGLTGKPGCGKSTVAEHLEAEHGFCRKRIAGPLKAMMYQLGLDYSHIEGDLKEVPCEYLGGKTPRYAMQTLGFEWGRELIHPDLWVNAWEKEVEHYVPEENIVVEDVRAQNEVDRIHKRGGIVVRIVREDGNVASSHKAEHQDLNVDYTIYNYGTLDDLYAKIYALIGAKSTQRFRRVILESPYAGDVERNVEYARACLRDSLLRGEAPIASHLLYTQDGVLDDTVPEERQLGIDAGLAWGVEADLTAVYTDLGISQGMNYGIARAQNERRPVQYRSLVSGK